MKQIYVLGTGTATCLHYHNTCFILHNDKGNFLVDGGGGGEILRCFTSMNIDWESVHFAFLTHEHTDHLLGMVWVIRYITELMNWNRYDGEFTLYSHDVALEKLITICNLLLKKDQIALFGKRIQFTEVKDADQFFILGESFTFFDIHSNKAKQFGFRLDMPSKKRLVFLGDEPLSENCISHLTDVEWLLSEAYCLESEKEYYNPHKLFHATAKETAENAERFKVKNLVIWHTEDETTFGCRKERYTAEVSQFYHGNIYVPDDFDIINL